MQNYDAVFVIKGDLPKETIADIRKGIEDQLNKYWSIKETDDIWSLPLEENPDKMEHAYFLSYLYEAGNEAIDSMNQQFRITKWLNRFFFYKMKKGEKYLLFADVQKEIAPFIAKDEE